MINRTRIPILLIAIVSLVWFLSTVASAQTSQVQVIDANGNVSTYNVRTFDPTPQVIPIKPYGLNLRPANVPDRMYNGPITFDAGAAGPGSVTIDNPYFPVKEQIPEVENVPKQESFAALFFRAIGEYLAKCGL